MSVSDLSDFLTGCPDCEIYAEENGKLRHELGIKDRQLEWNRYVAFGLGIGLGYLITR